jgi:hypothetical protein
MKPDNNATAYRVVLEDIKREIETIDSFSIKFSLMTNTPVTKVKYMLRSFPAVMWEGTARATAMSVMSYIEDAGGKGIIEEINRNSPEKIDVPEDNLSGNADTCTKCGFPVEKGDEYCQFCMSPISENMKHKIADFIGVSKSRQIIPPGRLRLYILLIVGVLLIDLLARLVN